MKIALAAFEEGLLSVREHADNSPIDERRSTLAAHLDGAIPLDALLKVIGSPLLYAASESVFDFSGSSSWFEGESIPHANRIAPLIARLGGPQALELLLMEEAIDASKALKIGIVNALCSRAEFDKRMEKLAKLSLSAIELAVELSRRAARLGRDQAEAIERYAFALRFAHADQSEGMRAFIEKRPPNF